MKKDINKNIHGRKRKNERAERKSRPPLPSLNQCQQTIRSWSRLLFKCITRYISLEWNSSQTMFVHILMHSNDLKIEVAKTRKFRWRFLLQPSRIACAFAGCLVEYLHYKFPVILFVFHLLTCCPPLIYAPSMRFFGIPWVTGFIFRFLTACWRDFALSCLEVLNLRAFYV